MYLTTNIKEAIAALKKGGVVVYPTDTAYGLGAKFRDKYVEKMIYKIKGRAKGKPLPVIVASLVMARKFFRISAQELALAKKYWPGPLSLLLQRKNVRGQMSKVKCFTVVRVPDSEVARKLSHGIGEPIFSTSANLSGAGECYSPREIIKQFTGKKYLPELIFDGGRLRRKKPSTIIKVTGDKIETLRQGPVKL